MSSPPCVPNSAPPSPPNRWPRAKPCPEPLSPALIEKAKILLARGNAEDQALAKIALKQYAEADRIIQDLKAKPGKPSMKPFACSPWKATTGTRPGRRDKAIPPYEQALALCPNDITARNNAALAQHLRATRQHYRPSTPGH